MKYILYIFIIIVIIIGLITLINYFIKNSNPFKLKTPSNDCVYNKLIDRFGTINSMSGKIKMHGTLHDNILIYLMPNSIIQISDNPNKEINTDINTNLFIKGKDNTALNILRSLDIIEKDCNLIPGTLHTVIIGNSDNSFTYSIRTLNNPAIVFFEKGVNFSN